jgi:hypothetical protein
MVRILVFLHPFECHVDIQSFLRLSRATAMLASHMLILNYF